MTRIAIGDVQGCADELRALVAKTGFSPDRDRLWFVGDLVNRGPGSLEVLRWVRSLGDAAVVVLGNHDLHLLAVACGGHRKLRDDDTLDAILGAPDREALLEWLLHRPLAWRDAGDGSGGELMIHAGLVPQWSPDDALRLAREVERALRRDPGAVFASMSGNRPDRWDEALEGADRRRFVINALTRLRYCRPDGTIDLKMKGRPGSQPREWLPWFEQPTRASAGTRVVCGHWSTLGLVDRPDLLALDTGCVWGGALTAASLDDGRRWQVACRGHQAPGSD
jgi:bis(5'-nucleosyl)-tetraphosphatase (symmetrical)